MRTLFRLGLVMTLALGLLAAPAAAKKSRLVVSYSAVKQLPYAGSLIAWELLRAKGYEVVPTFMPRSELSVQALTQGNSDFAQVNPAAASVAIASGADLAILVALMQSHFTLVTPVSITSPEQLSGKRIAVHSLASMSNTVVQYAIRKYGIKNPNVLIIPGSPARAQALLQGQIDATSLFLTDAVRLELQAPGRFHVLVDFTDLPVPESVLVVRRDWLATHQEEVRDVLRGLLEAHRRITANPGWAVQQAGRLYPEEETAFVEAAVRAYAERRVWDPNGGIRDLEAIRSMVAFLKSTGDLPASAPDQPEVYADLRPLNAVLSELGRY